MTPPATQTALAPLSGSGAKRQRPAGGNVVNWRARRRKAVQDTVERLLLEPWYPINLDTVAEAAGLSFWQIYYSFDGQEDVHRAVVATLLERVEQMVDQTPEPGDGVHDTIRALIDWVADLYLSPAYRALVYLRLRDGHDDPWLEMNFGRKVRDGLIAAVCAAVVRAGAAMGVRIACDSGAVARALAALEANTTLTALFGDVVVDLEGIDSLRRDAVSSIWTASRASEVESELALYSL